MRVRSRGIPAHRSFILSHQPHTGWTDRLAKHDHSVVAYAALVRRVARIDRFGMLASTLCAIHCAALPVLMLASPLVASRTLGLPWVEHGFLAITAVTGLLSIVILGPRHHRRRLPRALFLVGFAAILISRFGLGEGSPAETALVLLGAACIVTAHHRNRAHCRCGDACVMP